MGSTEAVVRVNLATTFRVNIALLLCETGELKVNIIQYQSVTVYVGIHNFEFGGPGSMYRVY